MGYRLMPAWRNTWSDEQVAAAMADLDAAAEQAARDRAEQDAWESIEAEESKWRGVFAAMPAWMRGVTYSNRPWLNKPRSDH